MINRKGNLYAIAFISILVATLFIYSCSNDDYEQKAEVNDAVRTQIPSANIANLRNALIDSVANSSEFWEFERSSQLLSDKFMSHTAMWSQEKFDKLMSNMNNDEYMEELIKLADLNNELAQLDKAKENLLQNTVFSELSESERNKLFMQSAESQTLLGRKMLKTPREAGSDKCEELKQAAYTQAKADYDNAIVQCKVESIPFTCYAQASAQYNRKKRIADEDYQECKQGK